MEKGIPKESRKAGTDFKLRKSEPNYFLGSWIPDSSLNNQPTAINKTYGS
jgi:hypothetical protein